MVGGDTHFCALYTIFEAPLNMRTMFHGLATRRVSCARSWTAVRARCASTQASEAQQSSPKSEHNQTGSSNRDTAGSSKTPPAKMTKTQAEEDAELRQKLESISGGGGEAGLELEDGQPVAMKRGVKNNMFRLI
ncbi:MAG: hypothetical protein Q9217_005223 [Psora testacea]